MTCRDRTQEFMATCKSMQSRQQQNGIQPNPTGATRQRTEFTLIAKRIGKDLSSTFTKLEKLTLLAKRKSLFDDKAADIEELIYIIKKDINSLNKQIAQLQEFVRGRGAQSSRHVQTHSNTVVVSLQSRLASMSNTFKNVLEVRTENMKEQRSRREHFTQSTISSLPPPIMNGHAVSLLLQDDEPREAQGDGTVVISMEPRQQQLQLIDEQDTYIQSRADAVQNIESTIVELGSIFQQLVHMVKEQEEQILRIDSNVDDTQLNVEAAHSELLRYFQSVTNNRWLIVKVFLVLILFFIIFVVFLA